MKAIKGNQIERTGQNWKQKTKKQEEIVNKGKEQRLLFLM